MGDTGSELAGLLILSFLVLGAVGVVGFKIIDRIEQKKSPTQSEGNQISAKSKANLLIIFTFLLIAVLTGAGLTFLLRPSPPNYNIQQPVRIGDWVIDVQSFVQPGKSLPLTSDEKGTAGNGSKELVAGGGWLEVEIALTNASLNKLSLDLNLFEVQDSQNDAFMPVTTGPALAFTRAKSSSKLDPSLPEVLTPGQETSLWVLYDLPTNISGLELVFKQGPNPRFRLTSGTAR